MTDITLPFRMSLSDSLIDGFHWGVLITEKGAIYEGFFKGRSREGTGRIVYSDGTCYIGDWHNDQAHGLGRTFDTYGNSYEGQFSRNMKQGLGIMVFKDKSIYRGRL